jgi:hypothetical protein
MRFREWLKLKETGTTTSCIAGFSRIAIPMVRRQWSPEIKTMFEEDPPRKKKPYTQPQVNCSAVKDGGSYHSNSKQPLTVS